jgi:hypothetical protein
MPTDTGAERWDVNQERVFLENLMQARFNFFLVAFGLWVVGIASISEKLPKLVFLGFGIVICFLLWLAIRRICQKVIAALKLIFADTAHPATQVHLAAGKSRIIPIRSNHLIGYVIPLSCILLLLVWGGYIAMWQ